MPINDQEKQLIDERLKSIPIFRSFSDDHLKQIIDDFKIIQFDKGENIVFRSDEGTDLYIVLNGQVRVSLLSRDGNEFILTTLKEGDFFGEMSVVDGKSRSADVVAESRTSLAALSRDRFLKTVKEHPVIAYDLLKAIVQRLRKADDMIESLTFLDVSERIVKFIADKSRDEGQLNDEGCYMTKKITHLDLALNIGSSREAVTKALKVLMAKEYVIERAGHFLIPHKAYDEMFSDFD